MTKKVIIILKSKDCFSKEDRNMGNKTGIMSEGLKEEIAKELGVYDQVKKDGGWGNVSSKTCGNIVSKAIEIANRKVSE